MTATPIRVTNPADMIMVLDRVLGFRCDESLVVCDPTRGFYARVDLDGLETRSLILACKRNGVGANAYMLVFFTEGDTEPLADLEMELAEGFNASPMAVFTVAGGSVTYGDQAWPTPPLDPDALDSREDRAATINLTAPLEVTDCDLSSAELVDWMWANAPRLFTGEPMDDHDAVWFLHGCMDRDARDGAWGPLSTHTAAAAQRTLLDLATRTPIPYRGRMLPVLAFTSWLAGDGAMAWIAAGESTGDTLSQLVGAALDAGEPPTTWKPVERADLHSVKEDES